MPWNQFYKGSELSLTHSALKIGSNTLGQTICNTAVYTKPHKTLANPILKSPNEEKLGGETL